MCWNRIFYIKPPSTAQQIWVPPSTMIPAVYAFNDAVADPWIAPAGINRGVITTAVRTERYISQNTRDSLYQAKVTPGEIVKFAILCFYYKYYYLFLKLNTTKGKLLLLVIH